MLILCHEWLEIELEKARNSEFYKMKYVSFEYEYKSISAKFQDSSSIKFQANGGKNK